MFEAFEGHNVVAPVLAEELLNVEASVRKRLRSIGDGRGGRRRNYRRVSGCVDVAAEASAAEGSIGIDGFGSSGNCSADFLQLEVVVIVNLERLQDEILRLIGVFGGGGGNDRRPDRGQEECGREDFLSDFV